jgi:hypothetical protein
MRCLARTLRSLFSSREDADPAEVIARRRKFVMAAVLGTLGVNLLMFLRFFYPRALYEPKARFGIGYPSDFGFGVDTKFQNQSRIWLRPVHGARRRTLEVDAFGIVAAAVAGALELIFALLPVRRAAQVSADGRDDEDALGIAHWPKGEPSQFNASGAIIRG